MKVFSRVLGITVIAAVFGMLFFACGSDANGSSSSSKLELLQVSAVNVNTWAGQTADISFTATAAGNYYYMLRSTTTAAPTSDDLLKQTPSSILNAAMGTGLAASGENRINLSKLTTGTGYYLYLLAKNQSNTTAVERVSVTTSAKIRNWTVVDRSAVFGAVLGRVGGIFAEGKFFVIGSSKIFSSEDGLDWISRDISSFGVTGEAYGITYGNGILMIGVGSNSVLYSADGGETWEKGASPFEDVSYGNTPSLIKFIGGKFIISLSNPRNGNSTDPSAIYIARSSDGKMWERVSKDGYTISTVPVFNDMAYGNGITIVLGSRIGWIVSDDLFETTDWTEYAQTWGSSTNTFAIIYDDTANLFLSAVGRRPYRFSNDGSSIQSSTSTTTAQTKWLVKGDGIYVIGAEGFREILYSANGENWSSLTIAAADSSSDEMYPILYGNGKFIIVLKTGKIAYSE